MAMNELNSDLYPDIHAAGGLIPAMEAAARKKSLDLGHVYSHYTSGFGLLSTAEADSSRGRLSVQLSDQSRTLYLAIQGQGFTWAEGATDDLGALVEAVAAWRVGSSVDNFTQRFPFMTAGRLARAHETGDPTPTQWNWLLTSEEFTEERPLVAAVHADGRFNNLFPNLSHGVLRLSSAHGLQGAKEIRITPLAGGSYRVEDTSSPNTRVAASLPEALTAAAESLSSD